MAVTALGDHLQYTKLHLEVQGGLVAVKREFKPVEKLTRGGNRGLITAFSLASRKRLLRKTARIGAGRAVFMTLTYPARFPTAKIAKTHLRALLERIRRRYPRSSAVWRLEYQKRGAPHFHLLFYNLPFLPFWTLKHWWADIVADYVDGPMPRVHLKFLTDTRSVQNYVSKYVAKAEKNGPDPCFFINGSYLHADNLPGRFWGLFNHHLIPFAPQVWVTLEQVTDTALHHILARLKEEWDGIDPAWPHGVAVFSNYAYLAWLDCLVLARQDMPLAHSEILVRSKKHVRGSQTPMVDLTQDKPRDRVHLVIRARVRAPKRAIVHPRNSSQCG